MKSHAALFVVVGSLGASASVAAIACGIDTHALFASADASRDRTSSDAPEEPPPFEPPLDATYSFGGDSSFEEAGPALPWLPMNDCDGGCSSDEYCRARKITGGRRVIASGVADASAPPGCFALPVQCLDASTCGCLMDGTDAVAVCGTSLRDCIVDDGGGLLMHCIWLAP